MSRSASDLEREVEASRASVEETVEALKGKMTVGEIVNEASRYLGESGGSEMMSNLAGQMRANPLPVALIGIGIAWLASGRGVPQLPSFGSSVRGRRGAKWRSGGSSYDYEEGAAGHLTSTEYRRSFGERVNAGDSYPDFASKSASGSRRSMGRSMAKRARGTMDDAGEQVRQGGDDSDSSSGVTGRVSGAVNSVTGAVSSAAGAVGSAASHIGERASRLGGSAYNAAGSVAGGARSGVDYAWRGGSTAYRSAYRASRGARRTVSEMLEAEPLAVAAVGVAIGAAIGALLPRTDVEDRLMGDARDRWREDVEEYARQKYEQGKAVAEEAFRVAREEAANLASNSGESIVDKVTEAARNTVDRVKESAAEQGLVPGGNESSQGTQQQS